MKLVNLAFLAVPLIVCIATLGLGLFGGWSGKKNAKLNRTGIVTLSLDRKNRVPYQNLRAVAHTDFKKNVLDCEKATKMFKEVLEYRNFEKHNSKEVLIKLLQENKGGLIKESQRMLLSLAQIDRRDLQWFNYAPNLEFSEFFVKRLLNLENADHTAEYLLDATFGEEAERIANLLNKKLKLVAQASRQYGSVNVMTKIFNWKHKRGGTGRDA